ncbi:MAG TPA: 3-isopropylmalate dehydratase small subunit [Syntrophales bacterium]|nr:3-isopropylmalate dehydratase small subunit [Syntrophobacterales bacterium]HQL89819.1 3-isopropylmalate dehydratase small subunit [Syntrophales bacterium]
MKYEGRVWKFGDDVDTDLIIAARYCNVSDGAALAKHAFADGRPEFAASVSEGDVIVGGRNFGCGSSREHAPIAIKAAGVRVVIAKSFARIFYRNAFNIGLPLLESEEAAEDIRDGDRLSVDLVAGRIENRTTGKSYSARPIPPFMEGLIREGGLVAYIRKEKIAKGQDGSSAKS